MRGPLLVDYDWHAFCQALYKGIEGGDWEDTLQSYKGMSWAVGVKKPQEAQKARALWKMKVQEKNTATPRMRKASKEETRQV